MKWKAKKIDEIGTISRGRSRHRPRDAAHLYGGPYPFIQTGDVKHAGLYLTEFAQTYSEAGLEQSRLWPEGTLCITIAANIADTSILTFPACFPDSVIGFIPDPHMADVRFVKYLFDSSVQRRLRQFTQGAAQDNLSQEKLLSLELQIPDLPTQRRIAEILSAYDDLIENNQRRMKLLEESARLLYQEWFVRLRFPGHEHTKIVDGVPEGWERIPASSAIEINPKTSLPDKPFHTFIEMSDLMTDSMVIQGTAQREGRSGSKFRNGDTLFARITPCLENGKTGFVNCLEEGEVGRGSTEFIVLRGHRVGPEFVYCLARTYGFREIAIKSMTGSSGRQRANESCFDKFMLDVPPDRVHEMFCDNVSHLFAQIKCLSGENGRLRAARDLLLPRLMNGEIEV